MEWEEKNIATVLGLAKEDDDDDDAMDEDGMDDEYTTLVMNAKDALWNEMLEDPCGTTLISSISKGDRPYMIEQLGKQIIEHKQKRKDARISSEERAATLVNDQAKVKETRKQYRAIKAMKEKEEESVAALERAVQADRSKMCQHQVSMVRKDVLVQTLSRLDGTKDEWKSFGRFENLPIETIRSKLGCETLEDILSMQINKLKQVLNILVALGYETHGYLARQFDMPHPGFVDRNGDIPCIRTGNSSGDTLRERIIDYLGFAGEWHSLQTQPVPPQSATKAQVDEAKRARNEQLANLEFLNAFIEGAESSSGGADDGRTEEEDPQQPNTEGASADLPAPPQL